MISDPMPSSYYSTSKSLGNREHLSKFCASDSSFMKLSHLVHCFPSELCFWMVFVFWVFKKTWNSLGSRISVVVSFGANKEMVGIDAKSIVSTGTIMAHAHPFGNGAFEDNPTGPIGSNGSKASFASPDRSVTTNKSGSPQPTSIGATVFIHFGQKPFSERVGKALRGEVNRISIRLHNQFVWLCLALGCSFTARAFSL